MRLTAFFKLYKICLLFHRCNLKNFAKSRFEKSANCVKIQQTFCKSFRKICKFCQISKISAWESGRSWNMLQNAYLLAKIGADTAENEQHSAEILLTDALWRLRRAPVNGKGPPSRRALGKYARCSKGASPRLRWACVRRSVCGSQDHPFSWTAKTAQGDFYLLLLVNNCK